MPAVGVLTIHLLIPGCTSLKDKRSRVKPLLSRLSREFNVSVAEVNLQDLWSEAGIACAAVSSDRVVIEQMFSQITKFIEQRWPDLTLFDQQIEFIY